MITFLQHQNQPHPHKGASYRERGMTLIEVVITIAIMGVIVGVVYQFLIFANRETYAADTKEKVVEEVNLFFLRVSQDIRNAKKCEIIDSKLTLNLSDEDKIIYKWDSLSNSIKREVYKNGALTQETPMVKNVKEAHFSKPANNKINIEVEVEVVAGGRKQNQTFSTMVTCRN